MKYELRKLIVVPATLKYLRLIDKRELLLAPTEIIRFDKYRPEAERWFLRQNKSGCRIQF